MKKRSKSPKAFKGLPEEKRYIIRKFIMARSAAAALAKERNHSPDDCYIDDEWIKAHPLIESSAYDQKDAIGFVAEEEDNNDE